MKQIITIGSWLVCLLLLSCDKETVVGEMPSISSVPTLSDLEISPGTINQFGTLNFSFSYTDGNGDIGFEDPDYKSLQIIDNRADIVHEYHIPPQSPVENIIIRSVIEVSLNNVILLDQTSISEDVTFTIRLQDRDLNWSNELVSEPITILK